MGEFLNYTRFDKQLTDNTVKGYGSDLRGFARFVGKDKLAVWAEDVRGWISHLHEQGNSRATIARKVSALRAFFRFLSRGGHQ